jgi:hypothetical protein
MATEYEQRLRTAILHQIAFQGPEWPKSGDEPQENNDNPQALREQEADLQRFSADGFRQVVESGLSFAAEKLYILDVDLGDGYGPTTSYTLVQEGVTTTEGVKAEKDRIKAIHLYVEGALAPIYLAEYGENGIEF